MSTSSPYHPAPPGHPVPAAALTSGVAEPLLIVRDLTVRFASRSESWWSAGAGRTAVDGVSLDLRPGECLGLVGESGCGKTTLGRAILRLIPVTAGTVVFEGRDVLSASGRDLRALRRRMQVIFQDPGGSLNPRMPVEEIVGEPLRVHGLARGREQVRAAVAEVLGRCGMPADAMDRYPHEFSGGQKQRIAIARALALRPRLIVCDEPTSALDVSVQAQILNLLRDLQRDLGLSYLFISHDLAVVDHLCDRIMVMKEGSIVESGTREQVIGSPAQAYTRELLAAIPKADPHRRAPAPAA